jgi:hypothetical protein
MPRGTTDLSHFATTDEYGCLYNIFQSLWRWIRERLNPLGPNMAAGGDPIGQTGSPWMQEITFLALP